MNRFHMYSFFRNCCFQKQLFLRTIDGRRPVYCHVRLNICLRFLLYTIEPYVFTQWKQLFSRTIETAVLLFALQVPVISLLRRELFVPRKWLNLDPLILFGCWPFPLESPSSGLYHQLMLHSYHPIFLPPYHFLKLVSFLEANRTKSDSVGPRLLRGAIQ